MRDLSVVALYAGVGSRFQIPVPSDNYPLPPIGNKLVEN